MHTYGLIGKKLSHSFSRSYFTQKFREDGIEAEYLNFELPEVSMVKDLPKRYPHLRGLNVTIPYKTEVIPLLDNFDPVAEAVGAVNTLLFLPGRIEGYNTDVFGFCESLRQFYPDSPGGNALILGTGGAAQAVFYALEHYFSLDMVHFASRNPRSVHHVSYDDLRRNGLQEYGLIINATPVGMYPNQEDAPDLAYDSLHPGQYFYDLIYNPDETRFMQLARAKGCRAINGMNMLLLQAEQSWSIWQGEGRI